MRSFSKIYKEDLDIVGKKAVELAELSRLGIPVPDGFVISTSFFEKFLDQTGISEKIKEAQKLSHPAIRDSVEKLFNPIKKYIMHTPIPKNLITELYDAYRKLSGLFKESSLNIFTSPLKGRSFQFLDTKGDANLILKIKEIWASHLDNPVAIVAQKNISSKIKGKIFSNDLPINEKFLSGRQIDQLAQFAKKIQKHFYFSFEIEYVIKKGIMYVAQVKPFTGTINESLKIELQNKKRQKILIKGISVNPGIVTGPAKIFSKNHNLIRIKSGEIIVLPNLNQSLYKNIKKAKGIVVDTALPNSHALMLYRKDVKIPTIAGAKNATRILRSNNIITINGVRGEIYKGGLA